MDEEVKKPWIPFLLITGLFLLGAVLSALGIV